MTFENAVFVCDAGVTYMNEYLAPRVASIYMGILYATAVLGPALGYIVGGLLMSIYTDFDRVDTGQSVYTSKLHAIFFVLH